MSKQKIVVELTQEQLVTLNCMVKLKNKLFQNEKHTEQGVVQGIVNFFLNDFEENTKHDLDRTEVKA